MWPLCYFITFMLNSKNSVRRNGKKKSRVNDCWPCLEAFFFRSKLCFMFYHHSSVLLLARTLFGSSAFGLCNLSVAATMMYNDEMRYERRVMACTGRLSRVVLLVKETLRMLAKNDKKSFRKGTQRDASDEHTKGV